MGTGFNLQHAKAVAEREDETQTLALKDETGEPMTFGDPPQPVTVTIVGTYSNLFRRAERAQSKRLKTLRARGEDPEAFDAFAERVASAVVGWTGFFDGERPIPFSKENAEAVFKAAPWIQMQVWNAIEDHERFFGTRPSA